MHHNLKSMNGQSFCPCLKKTILNNREQQLITEQHGDFLSHLRELDLCTYVDAIRVHEALVILGVSLPAG
jgi:hypothetical protein